MSPCILLVNHGTMSYWMNVCIYVLWVYYMCAWALFIYGHMCVVLCKGYITTCSSLHCYKDMSFVHLRYVMWYFYKWICDMMCFSVSVLVYHHHFAVINPSLCLHVDVHVSCSTATISATVTCWQLWLMWWQTEWCVNVNMSILFSYATFLSLPIHSYHDHCRYVLLITVFQVFCLFFLTW